jgi:hypothetical protein
MTGAAELLLSIRDTIMRFSCVLGCGLLFLLGCQKATKSALVPVSGTVRLDGKPLARATVTFIPDGATKGFGSEAVTNEAGEFRLKSRRTGDGAVAGTYKVTISKRLMPDGSEPVFDDKTTAITSPAKETLPPTYSTREKTTLTATVPEGGTSTLEFVLKKSGR